MKVGTAVVWHNQDGTSHTTTSGRPGDADAGAWWDSGNILFDGSFSHTFDQVGEFPTCARSTQRCRGRLRSPTSRPQDPGSISWRPERYRTCNSERGGESCVSPTRGYARVKLACIRSLLVSGAARNHFPASILCRSARLPGSKLKWFFQLS